MRVKEIGIILLLLLLLVLPLTAESKTRSRCNQEGFTCIKVKRGQSWQSLFPDDRERDIVMRINRTNTRLYPGKKVLIPLNLAYADLLDFSPFPRLIDSKAEKLIIVDPNEFAWGAYDADGTLVRWGPATSGADWCDDIDDNCQTKDGNFRVYSSGNSDCVSTKFPIPEGGAPMPYCMFFNGGQALHGSPGGVIPQNVSHGCVRLFVEDAEWLRYDFVEPPMETNNFRGTRVVVLPY